MRRYNWIDLDRGMEGYCELLVLRDGRMLVVINSSPRMFYFCGHPIKKKRPLFAVGPFLSKHQAGSGRHLHEDKLCYAEVRHGWVGN
jgi:hypothetical protein